MKRLILCFCLSILPMTYFKVMASDSIVNRKTYLTEVYYRTQLKNPTLSVQERIEAYDGLMGLYQDRNDTVWRMLYHGRGKEQEKAGLYGSALLSYQQAFALLDSIESVVEVSSELHAEKGRLLYDMARMSVNTGLYEQSSKYLYAILSDTAFDVNLQIRSYSLLGLVYINWDKLFLAKEYLDAARRLIASGHTSDTLALFDNASLIGAWYYSRGDYDSALLWMEQAAYYGERCDVSIFMTYSYNMANIYLDMGENDLARKSLLQILDYCGESGNTSYMCALAAQNIGYISFLEKDYAVSEKYYGMALASAQAIGAKKIVSGCYLELAEVYKSLNNYEKAWRYQKMGYELKDSVFGAMALEEVLIQNNDFMQQKRELEKEIIVQQLLVSDMRSKNKTIVLSVLVVLLLVFVVLFVFSLKQTRKQVRKNTSLHKDLVKQSQDMDLKNRALTKHALMLAQSDEVLQTLRNGIKKMNTLNTNAACRELIAEMDAALANYGTSNNWEEFTLYFEEVHPAFFKTLTEKYPALTLNEQRICALIYLNFNVKEIASITFRSARTIETVIHSIRKKMNIGAEEKTKAFLSRLFGETVEEN